ncbi:hypothetical protein PIB30_003913 [Stylosanthes scabra]|uniref:Uncharacterized protein n=1 Tax=Stylosanthes scabra TaxID=79078 RepID=A0ABU6U334_9FABA|nr:hypothetical protein [Stylosanthes scabra]
MCVFSKGLTEEEPLPLPKLESSEKDKLGKRLERQYWDFAPLILGEDLEEVDDGPLFVDAAKAALGELGEEARRHLTESAMAAASGATEGVRWL